MGASSLLPLNINTIVVKVPNIQTVVLSITMARISGLPEDALNLLCHIAEKTAQHPGVLSKRVSIPRDREFKRFFLLQVMGVPFNAHEPVSSLHLFAGRLMSVFLL